MPRAPPSSVAVSEIADAAPERSFGTDARTVSAVVVRAMPIPLPDISIPASITQ